MEILGAKGAILERRIEPTVRRELMVSTIALDFEEAHVSYALHIASEIGQKTFNEKKGISHEATKPDLPHFPFLWTSSSSAFSELRANQSENNRRIHR